MSFWDELENEDGSWEDDEWDDSLDIAMEEPDESFDFNSDEEVEDYYTPESTYQGGNSFTDDIVRKESRGNYKATNPNSSAAGKYQFLWDTWGKEIKNVTGVSSKQKFLNNPQAQDAFYNDYYVPNKMLPAVDRIKRKTGTNMSSEQLAKLYHFRGEQGALDYVSGKLEDKPEKYNSSISDYIKQYGGTAYKPDYNPLAPGQGLLGENLQLQNLLPAPDDENNQLYDFGFVEKIPDIYNNVSSWMKNKGSKVAQGVSGFLDTTNDYLSDVETTNKYRKMSEYMNQGRYFPINQTVNNVPIFT